MSNGHSVVQPSTRVSIPAKEKAQRTDGRIYPQQLQLLHLPAVQINNPVSIKVIPMLVTDRSLSCFTFFPIVYLVSTTNASRQINPAFYQGYSFRSPIGCFCVLSFYQRSYQGYSFRSPIGTLSWYFASISQGMSQFVCNVCVSLCVYCECVCERTIFFFRQASSNFNEQILLGKTT